MWEKNLCHMFRYHTGLQSDKGVTERHNTRIPLIVSGTFKSPVLVGQVMGHAKFVQDVTSLSGLNDGAESLGLKS